MDLPAYDFRLPVNHRCMKCNTSHWRRRGRGHFWGRGLLLSLVTALDLLNVMVWVVKADLSAKLGPACALGLLVALGQCSVAGA